MIQLQLIKGFTIWNKGYICPSLCPLEAKPKTDRNSHTSLTRSQLQSISMEARGIREI